MLPPAPQISAFTDSTNQTLLPFLFGWLIDWFLGGTSALALSKLIPTCSPSLGLLQPHLFKPPSMSLLSGKRCSDAGSAHVSPAPRKLWPTQNLMHVVQTHTYAKPYGTSLIRPLSSSWASQAVLWDPLIRLSHLPPDLSAYCTNQEVGKELMVRRWWLRLCIALATEQSGFRAHLVSVSWVLVGDKVLVPGFPGAQRQFKNASPKTEMIGQSWPTLDTTRHIFITKTRCQVIFPRFRFMAPNRFSWLVLWQYWLVQFFFLYRSAQMTQISTDSQSWGSINHRWKRFKIKTSSGLNTHTLGVGVGYVPK